MTILMYLSNYFWLSFWHQQQIIALDTFVYEAPFQLIDLIEPHPQRFYNCFDIFIFILQAFQSGR